MPAFANPLMLWGLAAASVPVIIHLLNRRRYRVQRWAAMEWLLAAARKNQKRLKMENLLLLLLRTCAVLFLALAIARPTLGGANLSLDKQASHLFIVLDNSASTGAKTGTGTVFEQAVNSVSSLLATIGSEDPVTLVLTNDEGGVEGVRSGRARVVLGATHDHDKVRRYVGDLKPVAARADMVEALKLLEEKVPAQGPQPKVAILTDLQRASFDDGDGRGGTGPDAAIRATLERLKTKGAEVVMMPFGRQVANVAVTSLSAQDGRDIVQGAAVTFHAEIRNFGDRPVAAEVRFLVDGKERGEVSQTVPLSARPAGSEAPPAATAQFTTVFTEAETGVHVIEARIAADSLPIDDVRTFAFEVRKPIRVLAIDGDPTPPAGGVPETFWLKPALAIKEGGPIVVQTMFEADYESEANLDAWDLVVLANVEHPARTDAVRKRLAAYLAKGGALFLTVGDHVVPDVWNAELWNEDAPILPARLGAPVVDKTVPLRLDLSENRHPILADITNPAAAVFFGSPVVWGRMTLRDASKDKGTRTVLTYTDFAKSPALIERSFGRGRVLLLTTTVDDAWGKLPGDLIYPPLLHEAMYHLTARGNADRNLATFQNYTRTLPVNVAAFEVIQPDGSPLSVPLDRPADSDPLVTVSATNRTGAFRTTMTLKPADFLSSPPPPVLDAFAVNMTPAESDLERLRPEDVAARWPGLVRVASSFDTAAEVVRPKGGELHAPLIIAAILCLLGEVLLVRRIAASRTAAA